MSRPTNRRYCALCGAWVLTLIGRGEHRSVQLRPNCTRIARAGTAAYLCDRCAADAARARARERHRLI